MPGSQKFSQNFTQRFFQTSQLMVFRVSLEMQSDSKSYVGVQDDEITELVHTIKSQWSLSDCRPRSRIRAKCPAVKIAH